MKLTHEIKTTLAELHKTGLSSKELGAITGCKPSTIREFLRRGTHKEFWEVYDRVEGEAPKILVFDIETSPIISAMWSLWQNFTPLSMLQEEWFVMSYAAKWVGEDEVIYEDCRDEIAAEQDSPDKYILEGIHTLLSDADIVVTQNGKKFDVKKLNARFLMNGMKPASRFRHIDTLQIAKSAFGFTSNKLEWMTDKLCVRYKKLKHAKFAGFELWKECLAGNQEAWAEMETYNIHDVLSLEELYFILRPWYSQHPNMNLYYSTTETKCVCGSTNMNHSGFHYTNLSKFDKWQCSNCGAEMRGRTNLLPKNKRTSLLGNMV